MDIEVLPPKNLLCPGSMPVHFTLGQCCNTFHCINETRYWLF